MMNSNKVNNKEEPHVNVDEYVDWRDRPCKPGMHGGMRAALAVLCKQLLSYLSYIYCFDLIVV